MIEKKILRKVDYSKCPPDHTHPDYVFWCPGCQCGHGIWVSRRNDRGYKWIWNGSEEKPTFSPSLLMDIKPRCHLHVVNGELHYCADCDHALAGKHVSMEPF